MRKNQHKENKLQTSILNDIKTFWSPKKVFVIKIEQANENGIPDLLFKVEGMKHAVFLEIKKDENAARSDKQVHYCKLLNSIEFPCYFVESWVAWIEIKKGF